MSNIAEISYQHTQRYNGYKGDVNIYKDISSINIITMKNASRNAGLFVILVLK